MSVLAYPPTNNEEIFRLCTKECGIITSTLDKQYFVLGCITCPEKFLYFDTFVEHMQTVHVSCNNNCSSALGSSGVEIPVRNVNDEKNKLKRHLELVQPSVVTIQELKIEEDDDVDNGTLIQNEPLVNDDDDDCPGGYYSAKQEQNDSEVSMELRGSSYMGDSIGSYHDDYVCEDDDLEQSHNGDDNNYTKKNLVGNNEENGSYFIKE